MEIFRLRFRGCPSGKNSLKYQNSPTHFHLPLFLEFFWGNLTKVGQNYINNKFAQSGRILPKIANNSRHAWRLSRLLKPQINRTMGPHGVNDDGSIFPGKSNPLQTHFLSRLLSGALSILMFVYKAGTSIKKRDFLFNIMCGKFRFDGDV